MQKVNSIRFEGYKSFPTGNPEELMLTPYVSVLIGKNNSGKSSCMDVLEYVFDCKSFSGRARAFPKVSVSFELDDEVIGYAFQKSYGGGDVPGNHYDYGKKFVGKYIYADLESSGMTHTNQLKLCNYQRDLELPTGKNEWQNSLRQLEGYCNKYRFRRINADRDIVPEDETTNGGGRTGITQQFDIDRIEKMIKLATTPQGAMKYIKTPLENIGLLVEALNERVENANRFCAYMTSRQEGRSVMRSISDAKEVTVNFNRKGASWKTAKYGNTNVEKIIGFTAPIFTHSKMFFNAGVQGFSILWNNLDKHAIKTITSMMLPPFLLGLLLPYLNEFLISALGGDDDDYANLSPWKRRNNLCIYAGNHQFVTIPLPIEQRAFFGLGDIAYSTIDNKYSTGQEPFGETMKQIADIFPVDYTKAYASDKSGLVDLVMPDAINPMWQIHNNRDWAGSMLHKEEAFYNKYDPKYELAFDNENQIAVGIAKLLNKWTADDKYGLTQGAIDIHPSEISYLTEQYFGGAGKDFLNMMDFAAGLSKGEVRLNSVPFVRGLLQVPNDKNKYTRIKLKYNNYRSESEEYEAKLKKFMKASKSGVKEQADYYKALAEEWKRTKDYRIMVEVNKFIKTKEKRFKKKMDNPALSDTDKKTLQEIFMADKKDLVERIEAIENQY